MVLLRILMSREAQARLEPGLKTLLAGRPYRLVAPDEDDADQAPVAFISRGITGLSAKHEVLREGALPRAELSARLAGV